MFDDVRIMESPLALERTNFPERLHEEKPWMWRRRYHHRIQKKWIKRFGYVMKPAIFHTPVGLFVHPSLAKQLRDAIRKRHD